VVNAIGDNPEYAVYQDNEKVAELGDYTTGWWDESKKLAWCSIDPGENADPDVIKNTLQNLFVDRRVILIETLPEKEDINVYKKLRLSSFSKGCFS
jgi:hypothetical protein